MACRLATDDHARITCLYVLEVPAVLPLDAHLIESERDARALLERAGATGDARGIRVVQELVRARDAASAIVSRAIADGVEVVVLGVRDRALAYPRNRIGVATVRGVLENAPCRVLVVADRESTTRAVQDTSAAA